MLIHTSKEQAYKPSKERLQLNNIFWLLNKTGYDCEDERDIVKIIEENNLDVSQFEFPGESFEKFKQDVLDGKYDSKEYPDKMTDEEVEQMEKDIASGKSYVIY